MKNLPFSLLISFALVWSCSLPSDYEGSSSKELVWKNEFIDITNFKDSLETVTINGLIRENKYQLNNSFERQIESGIVLRGRMSVLGDLNNDGIPEFLHEDIKETEDTIFGWSNILRITPNSKISVLSGASTAVSKKNCQQPVGYKEYFTIDTTNLETPLLVLNGRFGYLDNSGDCNSFEQATGKIFLRLDPNKNYLTQINNCPINNEKVELDVLYEQNNYALRSLQNLYHNYYSLYEYLNKFRACGDDGRNGISHLEVIAHVTSKNGNNAKRNDLMPHIEDEFTNVNPAFITWVKDNLIPEPTDRQANGLTYNFMYQYGYKQQFRKFALLKLLIMQHGSEQLMQEYVNACSTMEYIEKENRLVRRDNYNTYNFLEQKRSWVTQEFRNRDFETKYLENGDYGFLMRRMLDGSEPAIWSTMQKIFKLYDNEWYERIFVNQTWVGVVPIDSMTYHTNRAFSGADSIIYSKDSIPAGIAVVNGAGITIACKNNKEVTFINNNGDGESYARYELKGYWPMKNAILVDYTGWEWGNTILVYIENGKSEYHNSRIYPSKYGIYMAELVEEMEYSALQFHKLENGEWVKYQEMPQGFISDGYWIDDKFFFISGNHFFTFDALDFNTH